MKTITVNVSEPVYRDFQEYASSVDRSAAELIRQAMEEFRDRRIRPRTSVRDIAPLRLRPKPHTFSAQGGLPDDTDLLDEMLDDVRA